MMRSPVSHNPFFDESADFYDRRSRADDFSEREQKFLALGRRVLAKTDAGRQSVCIDLGCGPGAITLALASLGFRVAGVDSSPKMLDLAERARAEAAEDVQVNVTFEHADLYDFVQTFNGEADYILSSSVFEYLENPIGVLRGAAERLRTGGLLAVSLPNPRSLYRAVEPLVLRRYPPKERYTNHWRNTVRTRELVNAGADAGLQPVEISHFGPIGVRGKALFPRHSHLALIGTMTLVVLAKDPTGRQVLRATP